MKRVAIVQARMGSSRLPGKVLSDLAGRPLLLQVVRRLRACTAVDETVVATSTAIGDDAIAELCESEEVPVFRGSEADVLSRFVDAARAVEADVIVRVTADCPLIDPGVTDRVVNELVAHASTTDYTSNVVHRTYPRGLDVEAMFLDTLLRLDRLAQSPAEREHVTIKIRSEQPGPFLIRSVESDIDDSDLRWTVDEDRDLELVSRLYSELALGRRIVGYQAVVDHVRHHPELALVNAGVTTWTPTTEQRAETEVTPR